MARLEQQDSPGIISNLREGDGGLRKSLGQERLQCEVFVDAIKSDTAADALQFDTDDPDAVGFGSSEHLGYDAGGRHRDSFEGAKLVARKIGRMHESGG